MGQTGRVVNLPDNPTACTRMTLKLMGELIKRGKVSIPVRNLALSLYRDAGLPQKDYAGEINAATAFVRDHIRYTRDITGMETLQTPETTLQNGAGDCDDKVILLASLLESTGHPTRSVAIGFEPGQFHHVFLETLMGRNWIPLESTENWQVGIGPEQQSIPIRARMQHHN